MDNSRSFLIMVNSEHAPSGIGQPKEAIDWVRRGYFLTSPPRKSIGGLTLDKWKTAPPRSGDTVYIWINELYSGHGLSASAEVDSCFSRENKLGIIVRNVELIKIGTLNNERLIKLKQPGNVFEDIRKSTVVSLRFLSDEWVRQIQSCL